MYNIITYHICDIFKGFFGFVLWDPKSYLSLQYLVLVDCELGIGLLGVQWRCKRTGYSTTVLIGLFILYVAVWMKICDINKLGDKDSCELFKYDFHVTDILK
jgi:hypothetical protein